MGVEIVKKIVPNYKTVQIEDGTKEVSVYRASDGNEFNSKYQAEEYDQMLIRKAGIAHIPVCKDHTYYESWWYYLKTPEDAYAVCAANYIGSDDFDKYNIKALPDWFCIKRVDGGDSADSYYFYSLSNMIKEREESLDSIKRTAEYLRSIK